MTKQVLLRHLERKKRLEEDKARLSGLEAAIAPKTQNFSGIPRASDIRCCIGDLSVELADMRTQVDSLAAEVAQSEQAIAVYAGTIEDRFLRTLFRMRFIHGMTWKDIAAAVGGRNTVYSVRARTMRYVNAHLK